VQRLLEEVEVADEGERDGSRWHVSARAPAAPSMSDGLHERQQWQKEEDSDQDGGAQGSTVHGGLWGQNDGHCSATVVIYSYMIGR
jgi:hypothetical protein